jgi:putative methyltransferase (TIGR04325 family)
MRRILPVLKSILPPVVVSCIRAIRERRMMRRQTASYGWFGDYASWAEASADTTGYQTGEILQKALEAELKVRRGEAAFERDTVAFDKPDHCWATVSALLYCAAASHGSLKVVDFGGALGSTWSQYRQLWPALREVRWGVVELPAYVATGKECLQGAGLTFHGDLAEAVESTCANVFYSSATLQYLEKPYEFLEHISGLGFEFICLDRIGCTPDGSDHITVQRVDPTFYDASYPCWFLSREKIRLTLGYQYECQFEFETRDRANIPSTFRGLLYRKK